MSRRPTPRDSRRNSRVLDFNLTHAREVGVQAAGSAGAILRDRVDSIREIRHKGVIDIVTDVDLESERRGGGMISAAFPTHSFRPWGSVAPLGGTTNYAHGFPFFCVSIALEVAGRLVLGIAYAPSLDELFVAEL